MEFIATPGSIVFAFEINESVLRKKQIKYFIETKNLINSQIFIEYNSYNDFQNQLNNKIYEKSNVIIDRFYFMCHGTGFTDSIVFQNKIIKTSQQIINENERLFNGMNIMKRLLFISWIFCGTVILSQPNMTENITFEQIFESSPLTTIGSVIFYNVNHWISFTFDYSMKINNGNIIEIQSALNSEIFEIKNNELLLQFYKQTLIDYPLLTNIHFIGKSKTWNYNDLQKLIELKHLNNLKNELKNENNIKEINIYNLMSYFIVIILAIILIIFSQKLYNFINNIINK